MELIEIRQGLSRIGLADQHALHVAPAESFKERHSMIAGLGRNAALGQSPELSISARCLGLATMRPAGSRCAQRAAVANAAAGIGLAVSENGVAPGRQIWPVSRCRLWIRLFAATPCTRWLMPMHQRLMVAGDSAKARAAA